MYQLASVVSSNL